MSTYPPFPLGWAQWNFSLLGIVWNIQIHTAKSFLSTPHPSWGCRWGSRNLFVFFAMNRRKSPDLYWEVKLNNPPSISGVGGGGNNFPPKCFVRNWKKYVHNFTDKCLPTPTLIWVRVWWGFNSPNCFFLLVWTKDKDLYRKLMITSSHPSWGWVKFNEQK